MQCVSIGCLYSQGAYFCGGYYPDSTVCALQFHHNNVYVSAEAQNYVSIPVYNIVRLSGVSSYCLCGWSPTHIPVVTKEEPAIVFIFYRGQPHMYQQVLCTLLSYT